MPGTGDRVRRGAVDQIGARRDADDDASCDVLERDGTEVSEVRGRVREFRGRSGAEEDPYLVLRRCREVGRNCVRGVRRRWRNADGDCRGSGGRDVDPRPGEDVSLDGRTGRARRTRGTRRASRTCGAGRARCTSGSGRPSGARSASGTRRPCDAHHAAAPALSAAPSPAASTEPVAPIVAAADAAPASVHAIVVPINAAAVVAHRRYRGSFFDRASFLMHVGQTCSPRACAAAMRW